MVFEFLENQFKELPLQRPEETDFKDYIRRVLKDYSQKLFKYNWFGKVKQKLFTDIFIDGVEKSLMLYYDGRIDKSYSRFKQVLDELKVEKYLKTVEKDENEYFYRIRKNEMEGIFSKEDMFHIPFELRHKTNSQRFSIPGLPCLYLSNSSYVAWEELGQPLLRDISIISMKNTRKLKFIDLRNPVKQVRSEELMEIIEIQGNNYQGLFTYPLIALCTCQSPVKDASFIVEYVFPQFLMQWIKESSDFDGVVYSSVKVDYKKSGNVGLFDNYALPVKTNKTKGYCNKLMDTFSLSSVLPYKFLEIERRNGFKDQSAASNTGEYNSIELVEGKALPYNRTVFYEIEQHVNRLFKIRKM